MCFGGGGGGGAAPIPNVDPSTFDTRNLFRRVREEQDILRDRARLRAMRSALSQIRLRRSQSLLRRQESPAGLVVPTTPLP